MNFCGVIYYNAQVDKCYECEKEIFVRDNVKSNICDSCCNEINADLNDVF